MRTGSAGDDKPRRIARGVPEAAGPVMPARAGAREGARACDPDMPAPMVEPAATDHVLRGRMIDVRLRRQGENWFSCQIDDLSRQGFRICSFVRLAEGERVRVRLPGFDSRAAIVRWSRGHQSGCRFERALHPAIFDYIARVTWSLCCF